ncbi:hypothetical protein OG896_23295 [Streptomyces sp. NBC_00669]|uniref:hypothetical protein n=1 Tax=Streptomyces sp. NBC_00669 TaxID=2976011 RepID=UPI002E378C31|nr:hypothetical protein [Streptomyces sp. NBC_00669]
MHSSGRGEDSPEAYRGVVLPSGRQQQPLQYGEHVQPAGGTPWGAPDGPPAAEPADATQMLPPYPGADPLGPPAQPPAPLPAPPVADATQMLPPYPGDAPAPPLPPVPPQAPPPSYIPDPSPAEATQALPFFQDRQDHPGGYDQQTGYDQQGYGQAPYEQPGGYDQYPNPGGPSYGGQEQHPGQYGGFEEEEPQPGPGHDSDYDHLFRHDVPSPAPMRPRIIQPPDRRQPAQQPYPQGPGGGPQEPGYGPERDYGYDGGGEGGRRMSPKALIGIVVGGCVVAGLVVGALLNSGGGGGGKTGTVADSSSASPAPGTSAGAKPGPSDGADDAAKQQASALDSLLNTSDASRSSVVSAVASIRSCSNLPGAAGDLNTAADRRKSLVTQLAKLPLDQLPDHDALSTALTKAWQASSAADTHYANWAGQAQKNHKVCHGGHARNTSETQAGDRESGTATTEKKKAVKLWNAIAKKYGLTQRQYSQL